MGVWGASMGVKAGLSRRVSQPLLSRGFYFSTGKALATFQQFTNAVTNLRAQNYEWRGDAGGATWKGSLGLWD